MKKFFAFLTSPIVVSVIGLLAISLLIWFLGPHIKFGSNNTAPLASVNARLVGIIIALLVWGLNNLWVRARGQKNNQKLVSGLQEAPKDDGDMHQSDQSAEEKHQINERFQQALETLKRVKFKGARGNRALYELPWYIIVGPPGSGKTTALVNSGLEFPLADHYGRNALQGVGGTRNCDWWFTNDAVLIDTAGRYTTQDSHKVVDSNAWEGFLDLLKRNRRRRPINGAIVAISLQDLLIQTEEERLLHAKTIRTRLDELMERLQIRFPVYLMFTKADLISGFSEFFEDFGKEEREQVWGVSLPDSSGPETPPDFEFLRQEVVKLTERLYDRVLWRMHYERDPKRRASIQGFPQQFENAKNIAESFVRQTFVPNRFKYQPYLRGVYFTSGTQDGTPIDRLMSSVAANFGFTREAAGFTPQQGKSFFLSRLFREVIFPESELVGSNVSYERMIRWLQRGAYAAMLVVLVGSVTVWSGSVMRHNLFMNEVGEHVSDYKAEAEKINPIRQDVRQVLPALNSLAQAADVYNRQNHPWLTGLGLYDSRVDSGAERAYEQSLRSLLLPRLLHSLEQEVSLGYDGGDLYDTFRIYMMFDKVEHLDKQRVADWFHQYWETALRGEGTRRQELQFHLANLLQLQLEPSKLNALVVADTRTLLLREPVAQRVYSRVRTNPLYTRSVDLGSQFGDSVRTSFVLDASTRRKLSVPVLFTKDGYENIDLSSKSPLVTDIVNERWVLTDDEHAQLDFIEDDLGEISEQVKNLYLAEYIEVWSRVYNQLSVMDFRNLNHAEEVLANMVDPIYSPLISVLQVGHMHTQLTVPKESLEDLADRSPVRASTRTRRVASLLSSQYEGTAVDKHFRDLNALVTEDARGSQPVGGIMDRIQELRDFVADITLAPDPSQQAFDIARQRFDSGNGNPITALRAYAQSQPAPVRQWLESLSEQSWKVVLGAAHNYANSEWRELVYRPYRQALQGRYPLNRSTSDEMSLYDFSEFFKPGGTMESYYENYMAPFITTRNGWRNRVVDNYSFGFSDEVLRQVRNAQTIKDIFYRESPDTVSVTMELRPRTMDARDARFTLDVGSERLVYNHGPKFWKAVNWKSDQDNMRVRMVFEDVNGARHDRSFHGPWAWFRLLDSSHVERTGQSTTYTVTFTSGDGRGNQRDARRIAYDVRTQSNNNPFRRDVLSAFSCPESI